MKTQLLAVGLGLLFAPTAMAQTADELAKGSAADTSNVLNYGMGYDLNRFSPLKQINKKSVSKLQVAWVRGLPSGTTESIPLVHDGVMYPVLKSIAFLRQISFPVLASSAMTLASSVVRKILPS